MNTFSIVLLFSFLAACLAGPLEQDFSVVDEQGGYHFGFNDGHQARQEKRTPDGIVRGAYRYVDANGQIQTITYTADDHNGFVASGPGLPKAPEVVVESPVVPEVVAPQAVEDTPEVKAARIEHLEAYKKALSGEIQPASISLTQQQPAAVQYVPQVFGAYPYFNQQLIPQGGYLTYPNQGQPIVRYIVGASPYHPDYQPYAHL